jgi:hypothetical protein
VVITPAFAQAREQIQPDVRRWDEEFQATELSLARYPERGEETATPGAWRLNRDMTDILIYYTFDENNVYLHEVRHTSTMNGCP